jgi:hypothetical protein
MSKRICKRLIAHGVLRFVNGLGAAVSPATHCLPTETPPVSASGS